jgi:hypothetical protein
VDADGWGDADKEGNRYEMWWAVLAMVRLIDGRASAIRIEPRALRAGELNSFCARKRQTNITRSRGSTRTSRTGL